MSAKPATSGDPELDELLKEAGWYAASLREELLQMRPRLEAYKACYIAYIADLERSPSMLFGFAPPLPAGGHASLGAKVERECADAVLVVLRRYLSKAERALGASTREG